MVGGMTAANRSLWETYRWDCWEKEAIRWRTSWWVVTREIPSMPKVKEACSSTDWCPSDMIFSRKFLMSAVEIFSFSSSMSAGE